MNKSIKAKDYTIVFEEKNYTTLQQLLLQKEYSTVYILVDQHTKKACLPRFLEQSKIKNHQLITIPFGENNKCLKTCRYVWEQLTQLKADRKSVVINLGGGIITDLGGFVSATFKRGIDFIQIPTTLLAMVDASVGGKTGVDFNGLKNQIGLFANPQLVIVDTQYLQTLPKREFHAGLAEVIKYAITYDKNLWQEMIKQKENVTNYISSWIFRSIEIKNEIVLQDPKEKNTRKILNFGHTIGHAVETYFLQEKKQTLLHGEAVAAGMIMETYISTLEHSFYNQELQNLIKLVSCYFESIPLTEKEIPTIIEYMKHDKKNIKGKVLFVLLKAIAKPVINCSVSNAKVKNAFTFYIHN